MSELNLRQRERIERVTRIRRQRLQWPREPEPNPIPMLLWMFYIGVILIVAAAWCAMWSGWTPGNQIEIREHYKATQRK